jgi:hypothetical protein
MAKQRLNMGRFEHQLLRGLPLKENLPEFKSDPGQEALRGTSQGEAVAAGEGLIPHFEPERHGQFSPE